MPFQPKRNKVTSSESMREYRKRYDENRANSYARGYDENWKMVRLQHLQENPLCVDCLARYIFTPACQVHHVKKVSEYPELRDVSSNLRSLCHSCHSKRTAAGE